MNDEHFVMEKEIDLNRSQALGEKKISELLWSFSVPAITGMLIMALYNIVDSIFVGHGVGAIGLAAVTVAFPIMIVFMAFGMLIGVGSTTLISIRLGQKKHLEAEKILGNAFFLSVLLSIFTSAPMLLFLDPILVVLGATEDVLPLAHDFSYIIVSGSIFMFIGFGLNNIIRAEGNPKVAMMTMIIAALLNTMLNPLFIFGLGMGIRGSAVATIIAQAVSSCWVVAHFLLPHAYLKLRLKNLCPSREIVSEIFTMGSSVFFMQIAASFVAGLFNYTLASCGGQMAVAAMGVVNRVSMLILMPIFGISQGAQPIIGYNFGAQNYERVRETVKLAAIWATIVATTGFIAVMLFDTHIIRLFSDDPALIVIGSNGLKFFLLMLPVIGLQVIGTAFFQATGRPMHALSLSMSRQVVILIPLLLVLPRFFGVQGVWLAGPISDFGSSLLAVLLVLPALRKLKTGS
ncbi:MAG: MATE family efflux transporter [Negativicutes bacterium]